MAGHARVSVDETQLRSWEPAELHAHLAQSASYVAATPPLRLIDVREQHEYDKETLQHAVRLGKSDLMFSKDAEWVRNLISSLMESTDDICVFSMEGMPLTSATTGRDAYVIWYLNESGVALSRLGRLNGGFKAWKQAELPCVRGGQQHERVGDLRALLVKAGCGENEALLRSEQTLTLQHLLDSLATSGRIGLLSLLREHGVDKLAERQKIANAVGKASRASSTD